MTELIETTRYDPSRVYPLLATTGHRSQECSPGVDEWDRFSMLGTVHSVNAFPHSGTRILPGERFFLSSYFIQFGGSSSVDGFKSTLYWDDKNK